MMATRTVPATREAACLPLLVRTLLTDPACYDHAAARVGCNNQRALHHLPQNIRCNALRLLHPTRPQTGGAIGRKNQRC